MSKQTQRAPESESTHSSTAQGAQGPGTEDAGVATAEQMGNAATQEEMQGGQEQASAEGGWMEAGGELLEDAAEWGVDQITSVERFATFLKVAGTSAAQRILPSLPTALLRDVALWALDAGDGLLEEIAWNALECLGHADFLEAVITAAKLGELVAFALARGARWFLDAIADFDSAVLLQMVVSLSEMQRSEIFAMACSLTDALFEAVWPAGMGLALDLSGEGALNSLALSASCQGMARHVGGGSLEVTLTFSGALGGDIGMGEEANGSGGEAKFVVEAGGSVRLDFAASDATSWDGAALLGLAAGLGGVVMPSIVASHLLGGSFDLAALLTGYAVEGHVRVGGQAKTEGDIGLGLAAYGQAGLGVELRGLSGGRLDKGSCTLSAGAELVVDGSIHLPSLEFGGGKDGEKASSLDTGGLEAALLGGAAQVKLHFDFDKDADPIFSNLTVEAVGQVAVGEGSLEVGVETDGSFSENASDLIDGLRALNVGLHLPISDGRACDLLENSDYYELVEAVGLDVQGAIDIDAKLDAEGFQFIAETAWGMFSKAADPKKAFADLCAWAKNPLGTTYADLKQLLVMELAQSELKVVLDCAVTVETEVGLELALGTKWGAGVGLGATVDLESDLLKSGATLTSTDLKALLGHRDTISTPY